MRTPAGLVLLVVLAWLPDAVLAGRANPGRKETPAQQKANKARKDRARYGADAQVERLSVAIAGGGRLKAIRVERGGLVRERVRAESVGPGGSLRVDVAQSEQGQVIRTSGTSVVRQDGATIIVREATKLNRATGRRRVSGGSTTHMAGREVRGHGVSQVH